MEQTVDEPPTRRRLVVAAVGALALALVAAAFYLFGPRLSSTDVAVPTDDASPREVVTAYLRALDAGDCGTARALGVPDYHHEADMWCDDVSSLDAVEVREPVNEEPMSSGMPSTAQVVGVGVTIDVRWRPLHDDGTFPEGPKPWAYHLVRDDGGAWRIFTQGIG